MDMDERFQELYSILHSETKAALGCTGPIGACYIAAQAYDAIGGEIKKITVEGEGAKNDDVAFPGTEMLGVEMAYALGAVCGDPNAGMEVLHSVTPEGELKAREVAKLVELKYNFSTDTLPCSHCKVTIETDRGVGVAIRQGAQDGLIYKARNGEVLLDKPVDANNKPGQTPIIKYKIKDFYEFASTCPIEKLSFLLEARKMNVAMAEYTLSHSEVGIGIGKALLSKEAPSVTARAKAYAAAGCEGRMFGVSLPIMTVGGKGNVGIASSMPIISQAKDLDCTDEELQRALAISFLTAIAVIHRIGKAPTMCSCEVAASMGVAAGTVFLRKGTEAQVEMAIQNLIPNVFGVVCDGAKLACALRMASSTGIAIDAAELALQNIRLANNQGVLDANADASIDFLGDFALHSMISSDNELNKKMVAKRKIFPLMTTRDRQELW